MHVFHIDCIRVWFLDSSARGTGSDDEDDEFSFKHEMNIGDEKVMEWAKVLFFCLLNY